MEYYYINVNINNLLILIHRKGLPRSNNAHGAVAGGELAVAWHTVAQRTQGVTHQLVEAFNISGAYVNHSVFANENGLT